MKILFVGNMADIHTPKWADFFEKYNEAIKFHVEHFSLKAIRELKTILKFHNPDVLHAHYAGTWGFISALTGFHPFVVTVHGSEVLLTKGVKKKLVNWVLDKADLITCDAEHVAKAIGKPEKTKIIRFGVDTERFRPSDEVKNIDVISLRNHEPVYDIPTLIRAVKLLEDEYPALDCTIAGSGSQTSKLRSLTREIGANFGICFTQIVPDYMESWLQKSKVYVSTALSDAGLSSSTAEAMACGLPVIVTDVAENKKWVCTPKQRESIQFQLFKPGDHEELARRIRFFLRYPKIAEAQGKINRSIIFSYNNYETEMTKMEKLLEEVCYGKNRVHKTS